MKLSTKTTGILFSPSTTTTSDAESLTVTCGDLVVPITRTPQKMLGITLDSGLHFDKHVEIVSLEAKKRIVQIRALAGASWGPTSHSLRSFYKGYIESVLTFGADVWWCKLSETQKDALRILQRTALRVVSGLPKSTNVQSLHNETRCLSLDEIIEGRLAAHPERNRARPPEDYRSREATRPLATLQVIETKQPTT